MKTSRFIAVLFGGAGAFAFTSLAYAQAASSRTAGTADVLEEVTVTGSRVIANGDNSPTPVTVVQTEELLALQPTTITDALNNLPVFSGSKTQFANNVSTGVFGGGNGAANQLNLRNLGPLRNLILFDGQRLPPTLVFGTVDVDMVPQMLIQRVDVVTGGVSAVYGSDAISGVVNYVTDHNFNGIKAELQGGMSGYSDDKYYKLGLAAGTSLFGGRGHIEGSYGHYDNDGIAERDDRPNYDYGALGSVPGSTSAQGTAANPYQVYGNVRNAQFTYGGLIRSGALSGRTFNSNGVLTTFAPGILTGTNNFQIGGDGVYTNPSAKAPLRFDQLFGRFDYEFTDDLRLHTEVTGNWKYNSQYTAAFQLNGTTFSAQNAFLSPAYQTTLASANQTTFTMSKLVRQAPYLQSAADTTQFFINAGLEGKLGIYEWGADVNIGEATLKNTLSNNPNNERLSAALDAVLDSTGQIVCKVTRDNPGLYPGCVPLNMFGPTSASDAALQYVLGQTHYTATTSSSDVNAHLIGAPFNTWAGPIQMALSADWRKLAFESTADVESTTAASNCGATALRFNCNATGSITPQWQNAFSSRSPVSQTVKEAAIEFDAPLLKNVPLAKSLNLNGAARFTSYNTSGDYWTWKLGADWHITEDFSFRATTSSDIRAPTLNDLFQATTVVYVNQRDELTGASPTVGSVNTGNPDVEAEIGRTITAGLVWRPDSLPGFSMALDGYRIRITDAIAQLQGFNPTNQNLCYDSGGSSIFCTLQNRPLGFSRVFPNTDPAQNAIRGWRTYFANISAIETYGADMEMNYSSRVWGHRFNGRLFTTWQPHITYSLPGSPVYDFGGVAFPNLVPLVASPSLRVTMGLNYGVTDKFTVGIVERYRDSMKLSVVPTDVYVNNHMDAVAYTDLNLSWKLGLKASEAEVFANIRNVFDTFPPVGATGSGPGIGYAQGDDIDGRYYTLGMRFKY